MLEDGLQDSPARLRLREALSSKHVVCYLLAVFSHPSPTLHVEPMCAHDLSVGEHRGPTSGLRMNELVQCALAQLKQKFVTDRRKETTQLVSFVVALGCKT